MACFCPAWPTHWYSTWSTWSNSHQIEEEQKKKQQPLSQSVCGWRVDTWNTNRSHRSTHLLVVRPHNDEPTEFARPLAVPCVPIACVIETLLVAVSVPNEGSLASRGALPKRQAVGYLPPLPPSLPEGAILAPGQKILACESESRSRRRDENEGENRGHQEAAMAARIGEEAAAPAMRLAVLQLASVSDRTPLQVSVVRNSLPPKKNKNRSWKCYFSKPCTLKSAPGPRETRGGERATAKGKGRGTPRARSGPKASSVVEEHRWIGTSSASSERRGDESWSRRPRV